MQRIINLSFLILTFAAGIASAQEIKKDDRKIVKQPGKIKGEIVIKEAAGNNIGKFSCANLQVQASELYPKEGAQNWKRETTASGNFAVRRCSFTISGVPADENFVVSLSLKSPPCEQKSLKADSSFPMKLNKGGEILTYNIAVYQLSCSIVK